MNLQQIKFVCAVVESGFSVSEAAVACYTAQPVVSKHIKTLEDELGLKIFERRGKRFTGLTQAGEEAYAIAKRLNGDASSLKALASDMSNAKEGVLTIATTHTQARYVLPGVIKQFRDQYPEVRLHLHQGTSEQISAMAALDRIDFSIATGSQSLFEGYALLPCYRWHRHVVVPKAHPLARVAKPTLKQLAAHPIITYVFSFSGPSSLHDIFARDGLVPNVVLTARDADVIKTYVRLGLGVGIVASMAVEEREDSDLVRIDTSHLFPAHVTWIGFRRGGLLRKYQLDFMQLFAPHLTRRVIERAAGAATQADVDALVEGLDLPLR